MRTYNTYYTDKDSLRDFLSRHHLKNNAQMLVQVFTAVTQRTELSKMLDDLVDLLPSAVILGTTTDGEICSATVTTGKTVISVSQFDHTRLSYANASDDSDSYAVGRTLANELIKNDTKAMIVFADGLHCNGDMLLQGITSAGSVPIVAGGLAGDNARFETTYVFTKDGIQPKGAVAATLHNPTLQVYTDYSFNWQPIGKTMRITRAENNRVYTIDDRPAQQIYRHYLGDDVADGLPAIGIELPLIIDRNGTEVARAVVSAHEDGSLSFSGNLRPGDSVRFGHGDASLILDKSHLPIRSLNHQAVESIFVYSCMARRRFMPNLIEQEILPLQSISETAGFFTYGEFYSRQGKCELLNQTMTILALSETPRKSSRPSKVPRIHRTLNDYQKTTKALSHLLDITTKEMHQRYLELEAEKQIIDAKREALEEAQAVGHFGSWEVDLQTRKSVWSKESYRIYGLDPETTEPTLDTFFSMLLEEDFPKAEEALKLVKKGNQKTIDVRVRRNDGKIITLLISAKVIMDAQGEPLKMVGTTLDITEQVALREQNSELASIIEDSTNEVYVVEKDSYRILYVNAAAMNALGYSRRELLNMTLCDINADLTPEKLSRLQRALIEQGSIFNETVHLRKDGSSYPVQSYVQYKKFNNKNAAIIFDVDVTQLHEVQQKLRHQAYHDTLTGLPNRALFDVRLEQAVVNANMHHECFALFFIDLDNFKQINDTLGHSIGDNVLRIIAERLSGSIKEYDTLARLGGDEFIIILQHIRSSEDIEMIASRILTALSPSIKTKMHDLHISASIGISRYPKDSENGEDLLKFADTAMYKAKEAGKAQFQFYSSTMTHHAIERAMIEADMHTALEKGEFEVYYQPQVDMDGQRIYGLEALLRWKHPKQGMIPPDRFIPVAEATNMIQPLGEFVLHQAMRQIRSWHEKGLQPGILAINLSIQQLEDKTFLSKLSDAIDEAGFDIPRLELEITESQMMRDPERSIEALKKISGMGIEIAIDDFGTGYSSLAYLKRLPVSKLKIDKSFVADLPYDEEDSAIIDAVMALGKSMKLAIIAEGVEVKEQADYLKEKGCRYLQGYYFAKPLPADEVEKFLKTRA